MTKIKENKMNRIEKKRIKEMHEKVDMHIACYKEFYKDKDSSIKTLMMSDIKHIEIDKDNLNENEELVKDITTDEEKSYFVNKMNETMLLYRQNANDIPNARKDCDILYHSLDDYLRHSQFCKNIQDKKNEETRKIAIKKINSFSRRTSMIVLKRYVKENEFNLYERLDKNYLLQLPCEVIALLLQLNAENENA